MTHAANSRSAETERPTRAQSGTRLAVCDESIPTTMLDQDCEDTMSTTTIRASQRANGLTRFIPMLAWLPRYDRAWLSLDVIAGLTLWGLVVPEAMAYAGIAGLPPQAARVAATAIAVNESRYRRILLTSRRLVG